MSNCFVCIYDSPGLCFLYFIDDFHIFLLYTYCFFSCICICLCIFVTFRCAFLVTNKAENEMNMMTPHSRVELIMATAKETLMSVSSVFGEKKTS